MRISNAKAKRLMGINFIPVEVTLRDSAEYLVKNGFIKNSKDDDGTFLTTIA
jgi:dihydroflavonol-4-reductase